MRTVQYELFERTLDQIFDDWIGSPGGRALLDEATRRSIALRRRGFSRYGIKAILESVRFDQDINLGPDHEPFRVNNIYASRLARYIMGSVRDLEGFFETRELRSRNGHKPRRAVVIPITKT
jgi:hypothetical protein